jgi:mycothiol synthase
LLHLPKLTNTQHAAVLKLISDTTAFDNTPPIAEHILLHLRHGGDKADSHLVVEQGNQIIGYAHLDQTDLVAGPSVELIVDPKFRGAGVGKQLLSKAIEICGKELRLWVHGDQPAVNALAASFGFEKIRTVLQMSMALTDIQQLPKLDKVIGEDMVIRSFLPGIDSDAWLSLNNKVFKAHPEQGNWQLADLNIRINEEWFDEQGFFLAEINHKIIGSTWTKIHGSHTHQREGEIESHAHPAIGEIYITAVDQEYSGRGMGKVLTITALNYLKYQGLSNAMLYVDFDNKAALNLYQSLGFTQFGMDILYKLKAEKALNNPH